MSYFEDRVSKYPNRYLMTDANGNKSYVTLTRADEPTVLGTPLNAETFNSLYLVNEDSVNPGCFVRGVYSADAPAGAKVPEYMNPPNFDGEEYLTTKRFNGYPVYTRTFIFESLAEQVYFGTSEVVGFSAIFLEGEGSSVKAYPNPWFNFNNEFVAQAWVSNGVAYVWTNNEIDKAKYRVHFVVEYIKK